MNYGNSEFPPLKSIISRYAYDGNGKMLYRGKARCGTATTSAVWSVQQYNYDGSNLASILWANGSTSFSNIWDDRAELSYS